MEGQFDIIVIGSGLGGLECGAMLAREGMGVCVTEQADVPGGCLQSFSRRGHAIDTGMHYIGSMQAGGIMRRYFEYFGILGSLRLRPLDEAFDVVSLPGAGDYAYMHGYEAFEKHIGELFPHEKAGLGRYCAKLREIGGSIGIRVHRTGRLSAGERNTSGHRRPDSSANASQTRCCAMSSRGRTPSTEACAKARRSTTTR